MSQWTHVAGIVRIDSMFAAMLVDGAPDPTGELLRAMLGKTWNSGDSHLPKASESVPYGSEGSLQYEIVRSGSEHSLYWGHISIWGDLRDFDNPEIIHEWLSKSFADIEESGIGIRQGIVTVDVEFQGTHLIVADRETGEMVLEKDVYRDDGR